MTNKYMYFIANWKMFGDLKTINSLDKVIKFCNVYKKNKFKLIYCPPYTLLSSFLKKISNSKIELGAQNCHHEETSGPYTGSINSKMLKRIGAKYVIIGHSENRAAGDTDEEINKKIKSSIKNRLKIIFCIGETLKQKRTKQTHNILTKQIKKALQRVKKIDKIIFAYEPIWSIGTGIIPKSKDLSLTINFIKNKLKNKYKFKYPKVLYGGSVSPNNINQLKEIKVIDGFLIGGASQDSKKFIDIVKKTFN